MIIIQLKKVNTTKINLRFLMVDESIRSKGRLYSYTCNKIPNHVINIASSQCPELRNDCIFIYGASTIDDYNIASIRNLTHNIDILYNEYVNALKEYSKHSGIPIIVSEFKNLERMVS